MIVFLPPGVREEGEDIHEEKSMSYFQTDGGGPRALLGFAPSQLPSAQNNPYTKGADLGVAYSYSLHK